MVREIDVRLIEEKIAELCIEANHYLGEDIRSCISEKLREESWPVARDILHSIEKNIEIAEKGVFPLCQDTGMAVVFLEVGQDVHLIGGALADAVHSGVRKGYDEGYLRKSIVEDPLRRKNTGDNTPAYINTEIVKGDKIRITVAPKGFGSENMSSIKMLAPSAGEDGVKDFIVETCLRAGANPCPPIVVGVGIGGTFDKAALMAKKALLVPLDRKNSDEYYRNMEEELLERINALGVGPQGFGGKTTALAVKIITAPTHIAGLPVAVNINCHVSRHKEAVI